MTLGNLVALWQQNIRRLLAYSSIAHAGYMLIGLAVAFAVAGGRQAGAAKVDGIGATLFYLLVYALATVGVVCRSGLAEQRRPADRQRRRPGRPGPTIPVRPPRWRSSCSA